jgi:hypothetical protein
MEIITIATEEQAAANINCNEKLTRAQQAWRQYRTERCTKFDIPSCLAPYVRINKLGFILSARNRNAVLQMCHTITQHASAFQTQDTSNGGADRAKLVPQTAQLQMCGMLRLPSFLAPCMDLTMDRVVFKPGNKEGLLSFCQSIIINQTQLLLLPASETSTP